LRARRRPRRDRRRAERTARRLRDRASVSEGGPGARRGPHRDRPPWERGRGRPKVLTYGPADQSIAAMKRALAVGVLAAVALSGATARAERPRIAVMEVTGPKVAPDLRERMTHAVHEGLIASGADVVSGMPAAATGPGGAPCEGTGCVTEVAKATV